MHPFSSGGEINAEFGNNILNLKIGDFWLLSVQVAAKARKEMGHMMWSGQPMLSLYCNHAVSATVSQPWDWGLDFSKLESGSNPLKSPSHSTSTYPAGLWVANLGSRGSLLRGSHIETRRQPGAHG